MGYIVIDHNDFYVYSYEYPDGTPFYIGKGRGKRYKSHFLDARAGRNKNKFAVRVISKMLENGEEPIIKKIAENLTNDQALDLEKKLILQYGRRDNGTGILTNCTDGGDSGARVISEESKQKQIDAFLQWVREDRIVDDEYKKRISEGLKKYHKENPMTDEVKKKISASVSGEKNPFYGRKHTEESLKRMSESQKGRPLSKDHVEKLKIKRTCPHCGKVGGGSAMKRYHFDKCPVIINKGEL